MAQFLMAKFLSQALQWKARFPNAQFYAGLRYEPFIYERARKTFPNYSKLYPDDKDFTQKFVRDLRNRDAALLQVINPPILTPELETANVQFETEAQLEQQLVAQTNPQEINQPFSLSALPRVGLPTSGAVLPEAPSTMESKTETKFQTPKIPSGITSFGQNLGSSAQIGLKKGLGRVGSGLGSILGGLARGGGGVLVKAGGFGADALVRFSNQISRGGLMTGPSKKVWLGAVVGFLILFFILGSISGLPTSAPPGETAPIPGTPPIASAATSQLNCSTSMTAEDINKFFDSKGYYNFAGTGQIFYAAAQNYKINPALIIAIGIHESSLGNIYKGKSEENFKNAFGLIQGNSLIRFDSWADGINVAFKTVNSFNCSTIECIGQKYAPVGASNDPNNLNQHWVPGVKKQFNSIPQISCAPQLAEETKPDLPSGWPTTGKISQGPFEASSHKGQNAIDLLNNVSVPVYSTLGGTVTKAIYTDPTPGRDYGVQMIITNNQTGAQVLFAHLVPQSNSHLKAGQTVNKGDLVGMTDNTGYSTGPHLHYEIRGSIQNSSFGQFIPGGNIANGTVVKQVGNEGEWIPR